MDCSGFGVILCKKGVLIEIYPIQNGWIEKIELTYG